MNVNNFDRWFEALTGNPPFPWQIALFERFMSGEIEPVIDIPTGLGKTSVMAIWLIARAQGAALPRRLAYVVDRRAVVDQATDVAQKIRDAVDIDANLRTAIGLKERSLPISTLRGQHVDNREWLEDPALPAIIVGTVDMIGSRLLFEGYGVSRKMRPYHAGLLGADTLVVLDEAHLVPPFEKLLQAIAQGRATLGPRDQTLGKLVPAFHVMSLSATGRNDGGTVFGLNDATDLKNEIVKQRLNAVKRLRIMPPIEDGDRLPIELAAEAWRLSGNGSRPIRCIVFSDKREHAEKAKAEIERLAGGNKKDDLSQRKIDSELFVGGRRVFEREAAAVRLKTLGFIAGTATPRERPAFLFATSAGEVGVDLDADHVVCDLVAWERMVQRLGRVNRRGEVAGGSDVVVVTAPEPKPNKSTQAALDKEPGDRREKDIKSIKKYDINVAFARACRTAIEQLPSAGGIADVSTGAIRRLKLTAASDPTLAAKLDAATTPAPLRPALSRPLVDAWSMTSLEDHTGRPNVQPWLRGWIDEEPQTTLVWRSHLPLRNGNAAKNSEIESFFEAAAPHASELLEVESFRVMKWLIARAKTFSTRRRNRDTGTVEDWPQSRSTIVAMILNPIGKRSFLRLGDLIFDDDEKADAKEREDTLNRDLFDRTLVVDVRLGGLGSDGLLDDEKDEAPPTADAGADARSSWRAIVKFAVRESDSSTRTHEESWRERFRFPIGLSPDGAPTRWLIVDKLRHDAATEDDRSAGHDQLLLEHQTWTEKRAADIAARIGLPELYADVLKLAARLHDEGKQATKWQRAFNAKRDGIYAKTLGPLNVAALDGYRHEFGSIPHVLHSERFLNLGGDDLMDLALHLVAAHHGFARPVISMRGCDDAPPSALEKRALDIALRFSRLQKQWGPWGLAWWESLLRAADQQASRDNDRPNREEHREVR